MDVHAIGDLFLRFRDSPGGAALLLIAALLAIPTTLIAMTRWAVSAWREWKRRRALRRVSALSFKRPEAMTEAEQIAGVLELIEYADRYLDQDMAVLMRRQCDAPIEGKVVAADVTYNAANRFRSISERFQRMIVNRQT